ncbi:MAG: hypothetical protein J6Z34_00920 [Clostridia bacterium]|nr:hypothetical protein [Clostridia bacterium]
MSKKKKKEKVIYYDDGSTVADMSRVNRTGEKLPERPPKQKSGFREKWNTYWAAVKLMIVPMFVVLAVLLFLFVISSIIGNCA